MQARAQTVYRQRARDRVRQGVGGGDDQGRRKSRRKKPLVEVETRIDFDEGASSQSTLLQVVAQDVPGLLQAIGKTLSEMGYNVEVALVDTEGETAIDVFYLTRMGARLTAEEEETLQAAMVTAIGENAG